MVGVQPTTKIFEMLQGIESILFFVEDTLF